MDLLPIDLYGLILNHLDAASGLAFALSFDRAKRGFLHHVKFRRCQDYIYFSSNVAELQLCLEHASLCSIRNVLEDMCRKGRVDMVACVLNSQKLENEELYGAFTDAYTITGNAAIARMLIQAGVDPSYDNNLAIECASEYGLVAMVKVLLADPRVDPSVMNSSALMGAVREKHSIIVRLLIACPKITSVNDVIACQREAMLWRYRMLFAKMAAFAWTVACTRAARMTYNDILCGVMCADPLAYKKVVSCAWLHDVFCVCARMFDMMSLHNHISHDFLYENMCDIMQPCT